MRRIEVYFNLHKYVFSVRQAGKVIEHSPCVLIHEPRFVVQEGGRQRVLRERRKNVHAFVVGAPNKVETFPDWGTHPGLPSGCGWQPVRYNPYEFDTFVTFDAGAWHQIHTAEWAALYLDRDSKPCIGAATTYG